MRTSKKYTNTKKLKTSATLTYIFIDENKREERCTWAKPPRATQVNPAVLDQGSIIKSSGSPDGDFKKSPLSKIKFCIISESFNVIFFITKEIKIG